MQALAIETDLHSSSTPPELDEVTFRRARSGDQGAFRRLVERYHRPVYGLLWRMLEHGSGAGRVEDLTQETFVRVFSALGRFDYGGPARLSTWILTIATRLALNELRRRSPELLPLERAERLASDARADVRLEQARLAQVVRGALARMTPDYRAVLVLREYHDLSYDEIAETLGLDLGTVKSRLSRARAAMRRALAGEVNDGA